VYRVGSQTQIVCQKTVHFHRLACSLHPGENIVLEKMLMSAM
jgi:hypothetical protein